MQGGLSAPIGVADSYGNVAVSVRTNGRSVPLRDRDSVNRQFQLVKPSLRLTARASLDAGAADRHEPLS